MIAPWVKFGIIFVAVGAIFLAGLWLEGVIAEAEQADLLRQQIKAGIERQDNLNQIAHRVETELAETRERTANLNRQWSKIRAENPSTCMLDDSRIRLLQDATSPFRKANR